MRRMVGVVERQRSLSSRWSSGVAVEGPKGRKYEREDGREESMEGSDRRGGEELEDI